MEMIMSTPFIFSIIGGILVTTIFIYYQNSLSKKNKIKIEKSNIFYSAVFFVSACVIHCLISNYSEHGDISLKNVFKIIPNEMKTGSPPF